MNHVVPNLHFKTTTIRTRLDESYFLGFEYRPRGSIDRAARGMSQQHGVSSSLASIEAAAPTHGTVFTTSQPNIHPSTPSVPASNSSSKTPLSSNSGRSGISSGRVHIPKLSAATTALLARVAGNIRGTQHHELSKYGQTPAGWNSFSINSNWNVQNTNSRRARTMRVSSTLIELPTAPFGNSDGVDAPDIVPNPPTPSQPSDGLVRDSLRSPGILSIVPSPPVAYPTSTSTSENPGAPVEPPIIANVAPGPPSTSASIPVVQDVTAEIRPAPVAQPPPSEPLGPPGPSEPSAATTTTTFPASMAGVSTAQTNKPAFTPGQWTGAGIQGKGSQKRKRGQASDDDIVRAGDSSSDDSDNIPLARQTKSGRQVNKPSLYVPSPLSPAIAESNTPVGIADKVQGARRPKQFIRKGKPPVINCIHCQRGHSPSNNAIVFCDGCNEPWHQHCHDPTIKDDVVTVKEKEWLCRKCKPTKIVVLFPTVVRSNSNRTLRPPVHTPQTEVGGERFSTDNRRRYLSRLSHANLVELLLTLSDQNPTLPMFPQNTRALPSSNFPYPQATVAATTNGLISPNAFDSTSSAVEENVNRPTYAFQEHRLYPRAGNGIRLSNNAEDLDILQEDPACTTFSHALYGPARTSLNGTASY
ncbi:hypothetical protein BJX99DRAFT_120360 [Aspergillus californicus]